MSARLDLRSTFIESLQARGIPSAQRGPYLDALAELAAYLERRAPRLWSTADLEQFMVERAPQLTRDERPVYGVTMAMLAEILVSAGRKHVDLYLHLAGGGQTRFDLSSGKHRAPAPESAAAADKPFSLLELDDSNVEWPTDDDSPPPLEPATPEPEPEPVAAVQPPTGQPDDDLELLELDVPPSSAQLEGHPGNISGLTLDGGERIEVDYDDDDDEPVDESGSQTSARPQSASLRPTTRARRGGPRIGKRAELPGWSSPVRIVEDFGELVADERYLMTDPLPEREQFTLRATKRPREVDEYVTTHRKLLILTGGLFLGAVVGFVVHWAVGLVLLLGALGTLGVFLLGYRGAEAASRRPLVDENPLTVAREYIAALRLGLYHRAREMLALPADAQAVSTEELLANRDNHAFGRRFNTLSPAMLRVFWAPRVAALDDDKLGRAARLWRRLAEPDDVQINEIMRRDDASAAVLVVEAGASDAYAILPVVHIDDVWYIADGQCRLRSVRVDLLRRLGRQHVNGKIDDDGFVAAFRRHNLTRADITRGRLEGVLSESQASLLARNALGVERQTA